MDTSIPSSAPTNQSKGFSYQHFGKTSAQSLRSNPKDLPKALDKVYEHFLEEVKLDGKGLQQRIKQVEEEIKDLNNQIARKQTELKTQERNIEESNNKVRALNLERAEIEEQDVSGNDYIPFVMGVFIVLALTLFLFLFYFIAGWTSLYGLSSGQVGPLNLESFNEAKQQGNGTLALFSLLPVIFLGLGFLIHDFLEKNKYWPIIGLLFVTLVADALFGYKITEVNYRNLSNSTEGMDSWKVGMVWSDPNFYLMFVLGFVAYVMWGGLLHYVLTKWRELQPDRILQLRLAAKDQQIVEQEAISRNVNEKIDELNPTIKKLEKDLTKLEKDLNGYNSGVIPIPIPRLRGVVADFYQGWSAYTSLMLPLNAEQLNNEASIIYKQWLDAMVSSFVSDGNSYSEN